MIKQRRRLTPSLVRPHPLPTHRDWARFLVSVLVGVAAFAAYLLTLAPTISWRNGGIDSGELVTAIYLLGVAHPTGFPSYLLLGKLFTLLPFGDVAFRVNLMSATFAALTAGLLVLAGIEEIQWLVSHPAKGLDEFGVSPTPGTRPSSLVRAIAAAGGAFSFAFSPLFWSRATIAKEYTLLQLVLALSIVCLLGWRRTHRDVYLTGFSVTFGIGLGDHLTILSIVPGVLAYLILVDRRILRRPGALCRVTLPSLIGLSTYLYLPIRASQNPYLDWGDPDSVGRFFDHVTGSVYQGELLRLAPLATVERVLYALRILPDQLGWPAVIGLVVGVWIVARRDRPVAVLLGTIALVNLAFAAVYPVRDSEAYLLPFYLVGALLVGVGLLSCANVVQLQLQPGRPGRAAPRTLFLVAAGTGLIALTSVATNVASVNVSADYQARDYGLAVLGAVDSRAVVVTDRDESTFSLWYAQQVLGKNPTAVVVDERLLGWPWYQASLASQYPDLGLSGPSPQAEERLLRGEVPGRRVYTAMEPDLGSNRIPSPLVRPGPP